MSQFRGRWLCLDPVPAGRGQEHLLPLAQAGVGWGRAVPAAQAQGSLSAAFRDAVVATSPTMVAPELKPQDLGCAVTLPLTIQALGQLAYLFQASVSSC